MCLNALLRRGKLEAAMTMNLVGRNILRSDETHSSANCGSVSRWLYEALLLHTSPQKLDLSSTKSQNSFFWVSLSHSQRFYGHHSNNFFSVWDLCPRWTHSIWIKRYRPKLLKDGEPCLPVHFLFNICIRLGCLTRQLVIPLLLYQLYQCVSRQMLRAGVCTSARQIMMTRR